MGLPASRMRFIALSATLPNAMDFGAFIGAEVFRFGAEYRPVPLQVLVDTLQLSRVFSVRYCRTLDGILELLKNLTRTSAIESTPMTCKLYNPGYVHLLVLYNPLA